MWLLAEAAHGEMELLMQLLQVQVRDVVQLYIFEVMPAAFIPRVQVGGVARQRLQPDLAARARDELLDLRAAVDGRAIPNYQQLWSRDPQQVVQERDAVQPIERLLPRQRIDLALG